LLTTRPGPPTPACLEGDIVTITTYTHQDRLLDRLEGVREAGPGRWQAECPAHDDTGPSLSITQKDDGDLLLYCHAGCPTRSVLNAVGLRFPDLHPGGRWLNRKGGKAPARQPSQPQEKPVADIGFRHQVYGRLLDGLRAAGLDPEHRDDLHRRGLTDQAIERNGYASLSEAAVDIATGLWPEYGERLLTVPGIRFLPGYGYRAGLAVKDYRGLLIPIRDVKGRIQAIQIRTGEENRKYIWLSGPQVRSGSPVHVPLGGKFPDLRIYREQELVGWKSPRITEGGLKADVATTLDRTTITLGFASVTTWAGVLPVLQQMKAQTVRVAIDSDWRSKPPVAAQRERLASDLHEAGFKVVLEDWDLAHKGIDDLLRAGKRPTWTDWSPPT
jgi:hypothetical protein